MIRKVDAEWSNGTDNVTVDLAMALKRMGGDRETFALVISYLRIDIPEVMAALQKAAQDQCWQEVARHAHSLRGLAANVNCDQVIALSAHVESSARTCPAEVDQALPALNDAVHQLVNLLDLTETTG